MQVDTKGQIEIFRQAYSELEQITEKYTVEQIRQDKILYRAVERLLGIMAVCVKRLAKLNPAWQIPNYKTFVRLKNTVLWDLDVLRQSYLEFILKKALPQANDYLTNKFLTIKNNEN